MGEAGGQARRQTAGVGHEFFRLGRGPVVDGDAISLLGHVEREIGVHGKRGWARAGAARLC